MISRESMDINIKKWFLMISPSPNPHSTTSFLQYLQLQEKVKKMS